MPKIRLELDRDHAEDLLRWLRKYAIEDGKLAEGLAAALDACTRCGAPLNGCYKTPGDGPICCDQRACVARSTTRWAKTLSFTERGEPIWTDVAPIIGELRLSLSRDQLDQLEYAWSKYLDNFSEKDQPTWPFTHVEVLDGGGDKQGVISPFGGYSWSGK